MKSKEEITIEIISNQLKGVAECKHVMKKHMMKNCIQLFEYFQYDKEQML